MQLMPPTAKELFQDLKLSKERPLMIPEDLLLANLNIKLGTFYFARLLKKQQGNIPLTLAAYNAGPGRVGNWLAERKISVNNPKSLTDLLQDPFELMWIDELPWSETQSYVKSTLKNYFVYWLLAVSKT
jgi:soluble lytic murein transglycosylase